MEISPVLQVLSMEYLKIQQSTLAVCLSPFFLLKYKFFQMYSKRNTLNQLFLKQATNCVHKPIRTSFTKTCDSSLSPNRKLAFIFLFLLNYFKIRKQKCLSFKLLVSLKQINEERNRSFFVDFLNLNCQTRVLLLYRLAYRFISDPVLPELLPHHIVAILDRPPDLLLRGTHKVKLHYSIVLELTLADQVQTALSLRKNSEGSQKVVSGGEPIEVFQDEIRILPKFYEKVLVGFDAFELPVVTLKNEIEVHFSVTGQFDLQILGKAVLIFYHDLHSQHLGFLQHLDSLRLFLDSDHECVFAVVDNLAAFAHGWISHFVCQVNLQDVHYRLLEALLHRVNKSDDIKIKIRVREGLVDQGIVPPFLKQLFETVFFHCLPQQIPSIQTLLIHQVCVLVRSLSEKVKMAAHEGTAIVQIEDLLIVQQSCFHHPQLVNLSMKRDDCQVDCAPSRMPRFRSHVSRWNYLIFAYEGVEKGFEDRISRSFAPSNKMINCLLRPIGVIDQQRVSQLFDTFLHLRQSFPRFPGDDDGADFVSVDGLPNEINLLGIARGNNDRRIDVLQVVEGVWNSRGSFHQKQKQNNQSKMITIHQQYNRSSAEEIEIGTVEQLSLFDIFCLEDSDLGGSDTPLFEVASHDLEILAVVVLVEGSHVCKLFQDDEGARLLDILIVVVPEVAFLLSGQLNELEDLGPGSLNEFGLYLEDSHNVDGFSHKDMQILLSLLIPHLKQQSALVIKQQKLPRQIFK